MFGSSGLQLKDCTAQQPAGPPCLLVSFCIKFVLSVFGNSLIMESLSSVY
jgi:hypothetical protein